MWRESIINDRERETQRRIVVMNKRRKKNKNNEVNELIQESEREKNRIIHSQWLICSVVGFYFFIFDCVDLFFFLV